MARDDRRPVPVAPMIDLRLNYPSLTIQGDLIEAALRSVLAMRQDAPAPFPPYAGTGADRATAARWLSTQLSVPRTDF